jgi:hypothetical protein
MNRKRKNASETKDKPSKDEQIINDVNDLPLDLLADHIFPFVGSTQYRFVGSVC